MTELGRLLLERGLVNSRQIAEAVERQRQLGGRLGSCLLETGALSEEMLLAVLSEQLGVPAADPDDLADVPEAVHSLLPANLAISCEAVPFRLIGSHVDIAMLEARNHGLRDELSFVIGRPLNVHIANEARIFEALQRYYGKDCSVRFSSLLDRLNRSRHAASVGPESGPDAPPRKRRSAPAPPPTADRPPARPVHPPVSVERRTISLTPEERAALEASRAAAAPAPVAEDLPATPQRTARLDEARSPDEIGEAVLDFLSHHFVRSLLFRVRRDQVQGWMCRGPRLDPDRFRAYTADLRLPSVFRGLSEGGGLFVGALAPTPPHLALQAQWGGRPDTECVVCSIAIRKRMVSVLYGDRDSLGVADLDLGTIQKLAAKASEAFERCVLLQKQRRR